MRWGWRLDSVAFAAEKEEGQKQDDQKSDEDASHKHPRVHAFVGVCSGFLLSSAHLSLRCHRRWAGCPCFESTHFPAPRQRDVSPQTAVCLPRMR